MNTMRAQQRSGKPRGAQLADGPVLLGDLAAAAGLSPSHFHRLFKRRVGLTPEVVRERNLYRGKGETNTTHYGQEIEDNRLQSIWHELKKSSQLLRRRSERPRWRSCARP